MKRIMKRRSLPRAILKEAPNRIKSQMTETRKMTLTMIRMIKVIMMRVIPMKRKIRLTMMMNRMSHNGKQNQSKKPLREASSALRPRMSLMTEMTITTTPNRLRTSITSLRSTMTD